jgi:hypothetical protein
MCVVTHYRDFHCGHRWATIAVPCGPGMGFDTCPGFVDGRARPLPSRLVAQGELCPKWCVLFFFLPFLPCCFYFLIFTCVLFISFFRGQRCRVWKNKNGLACAGLSVCLLTDWLTECAVTSAGCMIATRRVWWPRCATGSAGGWGRTRRILGVILCVR